MKSLNLPSVLSRLIVCAFALLVACGRPAVTTPPKPGGSVEGTGESTSLPAAAFVAEDDAAVPISSEDAVRGSRHAHVTIVVFSEFQCPFCGRLESTLDRLRGTYGDDKLRIVFKHNPLSYHPHAQLAAEVGQGVLALAGQEAFWRYHALAFREQRSISAEAVRSWAVAAGADPRAIATGLENRTWNKKVEADVALAERLNATGTPVSFVNGVRISGAQPLDRFKEIVDAELGKAKALVEQGVPPGKVYARLAAANYKPTNDDDDDDRPSAAALAEAKVVYKIPAGNGPTRGPATALVTIILFSDFQCPFCKRVEETLARIRREYGDKVRIVWRDMPLGFHPRAEPAAELARAARAQKGDAGFWAVHDLLFESRKLEDEDLERIAREAKLDVPKAMAAVTAKSFKRAIDEDVFVGNEFKAGGTPHFFINGRRFVGAQPFDKFKPLIDEEITKAEALLRAGTPPSAIYDALIKDGQEPSPPEKKTIAPAPPRAPYRGAPNAKVVIQEVSDFQCPFCKRVEATIDDILKEYPGKVKVVWRDKPLPMHPDAPLAAEAAREAYAQKGNEGFQKMRKLLFDNQHALKRSDLDGYARSIGLDMAKFARALDNHTHKPLVDADEQAVTDAGASGTPAFFIGPYFLSGAQPLSKFRQLIELVLNPPSAPPGASGSAPDGKDAAH